MEQHETSNDYYGRLNDRFEGRSARLVNAGFKYLVQSVPAYPGQQKAGTLGAWVRQSSVIAAAFVMHADDRAWADELKRYGLN